MAEMFKSISAFAEAGLFPLRVLYIKPPMPCTAPPARSFKSGNTVGKMIMVTQRIIDKAREIRSGRGSIIRASQIDAYDLLSGYPIVCQSDPLHPFIHYP